jgi:hypothetical protein
MPTEVKLSPNVPLQLALADPSGVPEDFRVHYALSDGRVLTLPRQAAIELNRLDLRPGEAFCICRDVSPVVHLGTQKATTYRVWLPSVTEKERAAEEGIQSCMRLNAKLTARLNWFKDQVSPSMWPDHGQANLRKLARSIKAHGSEHSADRIIDAFVNDTMTLSVMPEDKVRAVRVRDAGSLVPCVIESREGCSGSLVWRLNDNLALLNMFAGAEVGETVNLQYRELAEEHIQALPEHGGW